MDNVGYTCNGDMSEACEDYKEPNGVRNCQDERNHVTLEFHKQSPTAPLEKVELDVNPLLYGMDDKPPWYMCLTLGLQHYLEMIGATVACPVILAPALCMVDDDPDKANLISTLVFMSGIITILQTTLGTRLPIVQGGSASYLLPSLAIMNLPQWKCPENIDGMGDEERRELWQIRMREIQGAIIFAAMFEMVFAFTGVIGYLTKFITPLTVAPAIGMIGLSFFKHVTVQIEKNPGVGFSMLGLLILFSQHLKEIKVWLPFGKRDAKGRRKKFPLFQIYPVLLALILVWGVTAILTVSDVLPKGDPARTDFKIKILHQAPWFRIPYPFQWGWPTVSIGAVIGVLCGVMTSTIESIGDYYACAIVAKTSVPPAHAINRGIFMEGLGCVLSGFWGSGNGSTSYAMNIGTIGITKVASRRVIVTAGALMIIFGMVGKVGALFVLIPDPILGGLFGYTFPLVIAVAIGTLSEVCLESSRNIFIVAFSIFAGLTVSEWAQANATAIQTGSAEMDSIFQILLSTGMFVGGITGFILDNTVPGTQAERGLTKRKLAEQAAMINSDPTYDIPYVMGYINNSETFKPPCIKISVFIHQFLYERI
ncbi:solute carrier family 23 member 2 isoform X2 [Folsomia candida]|uniref:solute carrier family 23 member 2 isoform X2 n=1 Tax=Folsomia candida TaxID=158441 RepID=UPI0016053ECB|nr:solute carrier family 23 member 2 isoform X2 [Folsomia candida]